MHHKIITDKDVRRAANGRKDNAFVAGAFINVESCVHHFTLQSSDSFIAPVFAIFANTHFTMCNGAASKPSLAKSNTI